MAVYVEPIKFSGNAQSNVGYILLQNGVSGGGSGSTNPPTGDDYAEATEQDIDNMFNGSGSGSGSGGSSGGELTDGYAEATEQDIDNMFN